MGGAKPRPYIHGIKLNNMKSKALTLTVAVVGVSIVLAATITMAWVLAIIFGH